MAGEPTSWAEWVERLARLVPGLTRYQDREGLRETDKQVRVCLAGRLAELRRDLEAAARVLTDGGDLSRLPALDRVGRVLARLGDQIRFASYGYAGVFDLRKIRETELCTLHRFDVTLLEEVPRLGERVQALAEAARTGEAFPAALQAAEAALGALEGTLMERDSLARGL